MKLLQHAQILPFVILVVPTLASGYLTAESPRRVIHRHKRHRAENGLKHTAEEAGRPLWAGGEIPDHAIMVARNKEDISWLDVYFNDIPHMVYNTHLPGALHPAEGGGKEAHIYLQYVIDMYDHLPNVTFFTHAGRCSWHAGDIVKVIQWLNWEPPQHVTNVRYNGFLGYNNEVHIPIDPAYAHQTAEEVMEREFTNLGFKSAWKMSKEARKKLTGHLIAATWKGLYEPFKGPLPEVIGFPCCATFLVTRAAIHRQPRAFYEHVQRWLADLERKVDNEWTARLMEATWNVVFGEDNYVPPLPECNVFKCDAEGVSGASAVTQC